MRYLYVLNNRYEGNTQKQKNPNPEDELSWDSWVIARIEGWKGYKSQRPPGTKTFKRGLEAYEDIFISYKISLDLNNVYKR